MPDLENENTIEKQNIEVDENYIVSDKTFYMCNFKSSTPNTFMSKVKNCNFKKCNLFDCEVDESNTLSQSNIIDTSNANAEPTLEDKLLKEINRTKQLEKFITDNNLVVPKEEVL